MRKPPPRVSTQPARRSAASAAGLLPPHRRARARRLESEQTLLRSLIDNVADTLYAKDLQGRFIVLNRAAAELVAMSPDQVVGKTDFDLFASEVARQYRDDELRVIDSGQALRERIEVVPDADGERHWYSSTKSPLRGADGRIRGIVGTGRDITERKRTEEALRESELRFRALFDSMNEGVALHRLVYDGDGVAVNYEILDVNPQFEAILGLRRADVLNRLATDVYGVAQAPYLAEYAGVAKQGTPHTFEVYFEPMRRHFYISACGLGDGRFATIFIDITARKQADAALHFTQFAVDRSAIATLWLHDDGRVFYANQAASRILGYSNAELLAMTAFDIDPHVSPEEWRRSFAVLCEHGSMQFESMYRAKDGALIPVEVSANYVEYDGRAYNCTFARDITRRRRVTEALSQSEAQYRLVTQNVRDVIWTMDADYRYTYISPSIRYLRGIEPEEALRENFLDSLAPESLAVVARTMAQIAEDIARGSTDNAYAIEVQQKRKDGSLVWVEILVQRMLDACGNWIGFSGVSRDIGARRQADENLRYMSAHDALTGLYNRAYFEAQLARIDAEQRFPVSVIMADVDGMKRVNDTQGHAAGDALLRRSARTLKEALAEPAVVARFGGDEFAVLLPGAGEAAGQAALARVRAAVGRHNAERLRNGEAGMPLSISLGVATATTWNRPEDLMSAADADRYEDKRAHRLRRRARRRPRR